MGVLTWMITCRRLCWTRCVIPCVLSAWLCGAINGPGTDPVSLTVQEGDEHGFVPVAYLREQLGGRSPAVLAKLAPAYTAHMPGVLQAGADENGNAGGKVFAVETVEIGAVVASN